MDLDEILNLAGDAAFSRGEAYAVQGRVDVSAHGQKGFDATAQGTHQYQLWLRQQGHSIRYDCSCPAADNGAFCKHLVAAALIWRGDHEEVEVAASVDDLRSALTKVPKEDLVDWLHQAAMADPSLEKQLDLKLCTDPVRLKKSLSSLLRTGGFLDWRRSRDYARRLDSALDVLESLAESDPAQCFELATYMCNRLLRIYERADDSDGMIYDRIRFLAELHARAAPGAEISGAQLASGLHKLKRRDDWGFFSLAPYWDALGSKGRAAYTRRVDKEVESLPEPSDDGSFSSRFESERVERRREEIARLEGDFETLIELLARDLSSGYDYRKIVEVCREFGHDALAMNWAERGLKAHPDWPGMRALVAGQYQHAGLDAEARELLWKDFLERPGHGTWEQLRAASADDWVDVRRRALEEIAVVEPRLDDGRRVVSLRVELLLADDAPDEALKLALSGAAHPEVLKMLAQEVDVRSPESAAVLYRRAVDHDLRVADAKKYRRIVPLIRRVAELDDSSDTRAWIEGIRKRYKMRSKLMAIMDKAGL